MSFEVEQRYYDPSVAGDWKAVINDMANNLGKQARSNIPVKDWKVSTDPNFDISTMSISEQNDSTKSLTEELTRKAEEEKKKKEQDKIDEEFLG